MTVCPLNSLIFKKKFNTMKLCLTEHILVLVPRDLQSVIGNARNVLRSVWKTSDMDGQFRSSSETCLIKISRL